MIGVDTNILLRLYVADHPAQHEAAAALGISRSYVSRIEKRALEEYRQE